MQDLLLKISNREDMDDLLNNIYTKRELRPLLKNMIVLTDLNPEQIGRLVQDDSKLRKKFSLDLNKLEHNFYRLSIEKQISKNKIVKGTVLLDVKSSFWIMSTMAKHYLADKVFGSLIDGLYPKITRIYLNYSQILDLLEKAKSLYQGQKFITRFSIGYRNGPEVEYMILRGEKAGDRLLKEAREKSIWVKKLRFKVINQEKMTLLDAIITNRGFSELVYGNFTSYFQNVLLEVINLSIELNRKYEQVRRKVVEEEVELHPCVITYPKPFSIEDLKNIAQELRSDYMVSISHSGNPYFSADLLDYYDGSSFGLTVLDNTVTITPMLRTTNPALWKLAGKVQDLLGEGNITVI
ncbi:MAG: hypothetical protein ABSB40_00785 [Nitrososphaeria archaeon]|jgi:hypothetical protein